MTGSVVGAGLIIEGEFTSDEPVVVEGTVRNNCDRPLSGVVRVQALNEQGRVVAEEESRIGTVRPDGRASFRVGLGRVRMSLYPCPPPVRPGTVVPDVVGPTVRAGPDNALC